MSDAVNWLNGNAGAVQAIATIVLVAVTAFYAWRTHILAKETKKLAKASDKLATEAHEQSLAAFRPVIWFGGEDLDNMLTDTLTMVNIGRGPAINIRYDLVLYDGENTASISRTQSTFATALVDQTVAHIKAPQEAVDGQQGYLTCLYEDVLQNRYQTKVDFKLSQHDGAFFFIGKDHVKVAGPFSSIGVEINHDPRSN